MPSKATWTLSLSVTLQPACITTRSQRSREIITTRLTVAWFLHLQGYPENPLAILTTLTSICCVVCDCRFHFQHRGVSLILSRSL